MNRPTDTQPSVRVFLSLIAFCSLLIASSGCGDPFSRGDEAAASSGGGGGGGGGGTGDTGGGAGGTEYTFSKDVLPILQSSCSCHAAGIGAFKVTGVAATDYEVVKALVTPGSPADSMLVKKGKGEGHVGGAALSGDKATTVEGWITQGAANN